MVLPQIVLPFYTNDLGHISGIFLIVIGSYVLNFSVAQRGYLAPFRALRKESGPRLMLLVAFLWSIAATTFMALVLFPIMLYKWPRALQQIPTVFKKLVPIGFFCALTVIFQMLAVSLTLVAHVIAIKRTSTVISVLWGFLKKQGSKNVCRERVLWLPAFY